MQSRWLDMVAIAALVAVIILASNNIMDNRRANVEVTSVAAPITIAIPTPTIQINPEPVKALTTWDIDTMNLIQILAFEEGFRTKPYLCSEGFVTIGLGTKLHKDKGMNPDDFPIQVTRKIAEEWLHTEVAIKDSKLLASNSGHAYANLSDDQRAIILSMAYQMGTRGVLNFRRMWYALAEGNDEQAAREALDSRWAQQTPERAERHARVLRGESLESVYGEIHG